jgi:hypothetical protein
MRTVSLAMSLACAVSAFSSSVAYAQWQYYAVRAIPPVVGYAARSGTSPGWMSAGRNLAIRGVTPVYVGPQAPIQRYYAAPQYRTYTTTPYMIRRR